MHDEPRRNATQRPLPHTELVGLAAPTQVWCAQDGTMPVGGSHGLFHGDWRYVRGIDLLLDGVPTAYISTADEPEGTVARAVVLDPATGRPIPRVWVERMRGVHPGGMVERVTLINSGDEPIDCVLELVCEIELAPVSAVRTGEAEPAAIALALEGDGAVATDGTRTLRASGRGARVRIDRDRVIVSQQVHVVPDDWGGITLALDIDDPTLAVRGAEHERPCDELQPSGRPALDRWTARAMDDLEQLMLDAGHGAFPAAGGPWHMTMVARDALITCRLLLPLGGRIAEGTLRTLAARQGVQFESATGEEPGRILHAMRQGATDALRPGVEAPPVYAGSMEPTPLWIVLLHDAWRAGLPIDAVRELRMALHAALFWLRAHTGDGFLRCPDEAGQEGSGTATAQAQGLACRAAVAGAALLDALGDDGSGWLTWAGQLRTRFRERFWVERGGIRYPAMALDADDDPDATLVGGVGQLIGTTLLSRVEEAEVARLLLDERLSSGFGLRTMATDAERYWPLVHDCGAIRPHETAIAIEGLLRSGFRAEARALAEQLERAADAFGGRMPELYSGFGLDETPTPIPYPGACSLRAWSAASVVPVSMALTAAAGAEPPRETERLLTAVPPSAPEPIEINAQARAHPEPRGRAHLRLVTSAPAPQEP
ncbi:Glycogen debranching enzyme (alpha-1,6-glucosidase) [Agrococcus baldri]|uniref:Glycogen debranching enzyme (Alpha-1,6-glucosidase) n=1 Tax=Agrococcus baldri TaxID=153730 RepID=A0AA94HN23_9MICO|nr:glycogen debranching N-terminal domain-containing protein [Agrococcus baldri]SFS10019.1 Glycogen debranching enzyme (alpha-1,6-glucosidase) [Agrococcus baldri]